MKIITTCHQCDQEQGAALIEIGNDNLHQVTCNKGHAWSLVVTQQKHEILFEVAVNAIVDGYYREAISSFSASLERYYEFFIKVTLAHSPSGVFEKAWKQISSQSERQLGAYIFLYIYAYDKPPETLSQSLTTARNGVIHKGYIPSRTEAVDFGEAVAKIINNGCNLLRRTQRGQLDEIIRQAICPNNSSDYPAVILPTYLNCLTESELIPLEEHLKSAQTHNKPRF